MVTKDKTTKKAPAKRKAPAKPRAVKAEKAPKPEKHEKEVVAEVVEAKPKAHKPALAHGKYTFATGRRKTSVANVRLFSGDKESTVNQKPFKKYFGFNNFEELALKPFQLTGTEKDFYFYANIRGGGMTSQAQALQHGISQALSLANTEHRLVLKKNGLLTRDDRKKERKKPGLKRARRAPQWAKR